ncbi:hypothetical protein M900_0104 [Bacteriovorax sp. Seq25_V]|nr:hypothetical protein M900_0104 [Bacteriovorax sp. Seq25_V]
MVDKKMMEIGEVSEYRFLIYLIPTLVLFFYFYIYAKAKLKV